MELRPEMHVLVMGLAKSGEAVTRLLLERGVKVTVNERRERNHENFDENQLETAGAVLVFGGHPLSLLDEDLAFIVKNPGISYSVPLLQEALHREIPVFTEIEVASWLCAGPIYAITGSNGKTTTTTLVGEMLDIADMEPVVAGNIGRVFSGVVEQVQPSQPVVLEVSSFQLMGTQTFHPKIGALLNVYASHLDYHETFEAYFDAKWKMFANMTANDFVVLNYDQPIIRDRANELVAQHVWFSRESEVSSGTFVRDGKLWVRRKGTDKPVISLHAIALKGEHNLENALAAAAIAIWAGAPISAVEYVLSRFRGVEHRQELVRSVNGVDYVNDSKATNPVAAIRALRSYPEEGRMIWIAGGLNRGDDFSSLVPELRGRVRAAILLGQSADRLQAVCQEAGISQIEHVTSLEQAVQLAAKAAVPGDTVLLSPACASWDMFSSFEERGRMFKDVVHTL